ncbi:MAG: gliding motility-associated C-terminal domain-containing protein [Bacteroidetes bacterium]|nr:gliding motility-associated C-terminal domain-containing protein [Bacteroidota bacterium]
MKYLIFLFIFFINFYVAQAQLESNIWYFGHNAGITFSNSPPTALTNGALDTREGCATICDNTGNLLFYTDGITVYNKLHQIMDNGSGLHGNPSSTQSAIIVPKPSGNNIFYIFTVDAYGGSGGLQYSEVDMNLNAGIGKVINKNIIILQPTSEKVTVAKHSNNSSYWLITHGINSNDFYSFLISSTGINTTAVISSVGLTQLYDVSVVGYLKVSSNNHKLASARWSAPGILEIFDFNNTNGQVSNNQLIASNEEFYGVEFSPNNNMLYVSLFNPSKIYQFNLLASNIANSKTTINSNSFYFGGALQIGLDSKIYYCQENNPYLSVINNPDNINCNFYQNTISLNGKLSNIGLPNIIPSLIIINNCVPVASFNSSQTNVCQGEQIFFTNTSSVPTTSQKWLINNQLFDTNYNSSYIFNNAGQFNISLIVFNDTCSDTSDLIINVNPVAYSILNPNICQGDTFKVGIHNYISSGSYIDILTTNSGCDSIIKTNLTITAFPVLNLGNDTTICNGEPFLLDVSTVNGIYLWQDNSVNSVYNISDQGLYWVKVSIDSCSITDSIYIYTRDCSAILEMPNIITPNGDGINDILIPAKIKNVLKMHTMIYNRWGNKIYETDKLNIEWDGKINDRIVADGVYYWIINYTDINGKEKMIKGSLTVMK